MKHNINQQEPKDRKKTNTLTNTFQYYLMFEIPLVSNSFPKLISNLKNSVDLFWIEKGNSEKNV